jgi:hypothetical protein
MKKSKDGYWIREYLRNNTINTNYVFSYFNKKFMVLFEPINPGVSLKNTLWKDPEFPRNSHDIKDRKLTPLEVVTYKMLGHLE